MRERDATATVRTAPLSEFSDGAAALSRDELERLIPAKLSEILLDLVARHPDLMGEVAEAVRRARKTSPESEPPDESVMVGSCPVMRTTFERIRRFAAVGAPVLICGESGTGKELAAKAIHERSQFSRGPFIAVNCGGLPESLVASELFGYERGAFTGATERRIGRIEAANGGTLFLDEIGDMPLALQPQLLRFLQEMAFHRVGGKELVPVKLRVISATNVDLEQAVEEGRFRKDLYFRLNVLRLHLPALRERHGDVLVLMRYLLRRIAEEHGCDVPVLTPAAETALETHDWPGNIRELTSAIRRAVIMCDTGTLDVDDFGFPDGGDEGTLAGPADGKPSRRRSRKPSPAELLHVLGETDNNITRTAERFGVSRVTIYKWLREAGH